MNRERIEKALSEDTTLAETLRQARREQDGIVMWDFHKSRVENVILKLARQHAAYEFNEPQLDEPIYVSFKPFISMSESEREAFENPEPPEFSPWPEVGCRAMLRIVQGPDVAESGWIVIQDGNYRFRVLMDGGIRVQFVLREYLACDVLWK